jgi:hypothetical protein
VIAVGQLSVGVAAAGQLGVGMVFGTGMLGFGTFAGGLLPVAGLGRMRLPDLLSLRFQPDWIPRPLRPWRIVYVLALTAIVAVAALIPLWQELFAVDGVFYEPPPRQ